MLGLLIGTAILIGVVCIALLISTYDTYESHYCKYPDEINIKGIKDSCTCVLTRMKFNRWRKLFELNPWNFIFLTDSGHKININQMTYNFRWAHPSYYDEKEEKLYVIEFNYKEYFHYFWYRRKIIKLYSDIFGDRITQEIIGTVQAKIDALVDESQKQIEESLNLQKEIILQLSNTKEGGTFNGSSLDVRNQMQRIE